MASAGGSSRRSSHVYVDLEAFTPPPEPSPTLPLKPAVPPSSNLFEQPYVKPLGAVFCGDEWTPVIDSLDDNVIRLIGVCQTVAVNINMDIDDISWSGFHSNILALNELTIADIMRDCWMIMYEVICKGYGWMALCEERNIIARVKHNLRESQPRMRWNGAFEVTFGSPWLDVLFRRCDSVLTCHGRRDETRRG